MMSSHGASTAGPENLTTQPCLTDTPVACISMEAPPAPWPCRPNLYLKSHTMAVGSSELSLKQSRRAAPALPPPPIRRAGIWFGFRMRSTQFCRQPTFISITSCFLSLCFHFTFRAAEHPPPNAALPVSFLSFIQSHVSRLWNLFMYAIP